GQGDPECPLVAVEADQAEDDGAVAGVGAVVFVVQDGVEVAQDRDGVWVINGGCPERVAGQRGDGRSRGAFAAHIAQEQPPGAGGQREQVVEVTADLLGGGDVVVRGHVQSWHFGQGGRQQGGLQGG